MKPPVKLLHIAQGHLLSIAHLKADARQTKLGYAWLIIGRVVQFTFMGAVLGVVLGIRTPDYVPYLAAGLTTWTLISQSLTASASAFIKNRGLIMAMQLDLRALVWKSFWNVLITFLLLSPLPFLLSLAFGSPNLGVGIIFLPLSILLVAPILVNTGIALAYISCRFRDVIPALNSALALMMFLIPVIWKFESVKATAYEPFVWWNIFYHLVEIVRQPLIGEIPSLSSFVFACAAAVVSWFISRSTMRHFDRNITLWL